MSDFFLPFLSFRMARAAGYTDSPTDSWLNVERFLRGDEGGLNSAEGTDSTELPIFLIYIKTHIVHDTFIYSAHIHAPTS